VRTSALSPPPLPHHLMANREDAITLVHLPDGPTAYLKLTSIELTKKIFVRPHSGFLWGILVHPEHCFENRVTHEQHPITQNWCSTTLSRVSDTPSGECSRRSSHHFRNSKDGKLSRCTISVTFYSSDAIGKSQIPLDISTLTRRHHQVTLFDLRKRSHYKRSARGLRSSYGR